MNARSPSASCARTACARCGARRRNLMHSSTRRCRCRIIARRIRSAGAHVRYCCCAPSGSAAPAARRRCTCPNSLNTLSLPHMYSRPAAGSNSFSPLYSAPSFTCAHYFPWKINRPNFVIGQKRFHIDFLTLLPVICFRSETLYRLPPWSNRILIFGLPVCCYYWIKN